MRRFTFRPEVLAQARHDRYHHPRPRGQRKMAALWLKGQGFTHDDAAERAGVSPRPAQRHLDESEQGGPGGFADSTGRACPASWAGIRPLWKATSRRARRALPARRSRPSRG